MGVGHWPIVESGKRRTRAAHPGARVALVDQLARSIE